MAAEAEKALDALTASFIASAKKRCASEGFGQTEDKISAGELGIDDIARPAAHGDGGEFECGGLRAHDEGDRGIVLHHLPAELDGGGIRQGVVDDDCVEGGGGERVECVTSGGGDGGLSGADELGREAFAIEARGTGDEHRGQITTGIASRGGVLVIAWVARCA